MSQKAVAPPLQQIRAAWAALDNGVFAASSLDWGHAAPAVVVVGAHGGCGATTVALAIAHAMGSAHLLELAATPRAGLVAASSVELGEVAEGWWRGQRAAVTVERLSRGPRMCAIPAVRPTTDALVVDLADAARQWGLESGPMQLLLERAELVVVVAAATVPGLRQLAASLEQVPDLSKLCVALLGPPVRKWKPAVTAACPRAWRPGGNARVVVVEPDPLLSITGVTPDPLPKGVQTAAAHLLRLAREPQ